MHDDCVAIQYTVIRKKEHTFTIIANNSLMRVVVYTLYRVGRMNSELRMDIQTNAMPVKKWHYGSREGTGHEPGSSPGLSLVPP